MIDLSSIIGFSLVAFMMVLSPGPNMIYLISRSICQGKKAGYISLLGVGVGFVFYMMLASLGLTAILFSKPYIYDIIKFLGVFYLLWLAWNAIKVGGSSAFEVKNLAFDSNLKLFSMGLLTNLLNPKIAIMYMSLLPQFIDSNKNIFIQSIFLGTIQIVISLTVNSLIVLFSGSIAIFLSKNPVAARIQRYLMGGVLIFLAIQVLLNP